MAEDPANLKSENPDLEKQRSWALVPGVSFLLSLFLMFTYDLVIWFFDMVIHTFFRQLTMRGTFNIPKKGAVIFVVAPHHNQFVDPLVLMTSVRKAAGRRVSLLTAAKSYRTWYVGVPARLCSAIPVERAQDLVHAATGKIRVENFGPENENVVIIGEGTRFKSEAMAKGLIGLPRYLGNAQIEEIESDTRLRLRKAFKINFDKPSEKEEEMIRLLKEGTDYVVAPHVDNHKVFQNVFDHLNAEKVLGIFPEGGLHDRPNLLPLKPGVAIMALGAVSQSKDPNQVVKIIPVGLNYFHPHKFRSRVVIEFGKPILVTKDDAAKYEKNTRDVVNKLLDLITLRLKEITVNCDDYDTLMTIHAARRLYTSSVRKSIPLPLVVEMSRRILQGYQKYADRPDVQQLKNAVYEYNKKLMILGLHDHQVESLTRSNRLSVLIMFLHRLFLTTLFFLLSLPGVIMFSPVFIVARRISREKQKQALAGSTVKIKAKDVIGTWKILVALVLAPALYIFWAAVATFALVKFGIAGLVPKTLTFLIGYLICVLITYASLRVGEVGMDAYKSLTPLFYSILLAHRDILQIENLKETRRKLAEQVVEFCDRYGPSMFDDFDEFYNKYHGYNEDDDKIRHDTMQSEDISLSRSVSPNSVSLLNLSDIQIFSNAYDGTESGDESSPHSEDRKALEPEATPQPKEEQEAQLRLRKTKHSQVND